MQMYMTGFADEASVSIDGQIEATLALGWCNIEARNIDGANIHDLPEDMFDIIYGKLNDAGVHINCFGSAIANWSKKIDEPFDTSLDATMRAIPRMRRLGTQMVRIMSFALLEDRGPDDQMEEERFRRLREIVGMFADAGVQAVHENCMCYGGISWKHSLKLLENVPGLKLVFDTGNPTVTPDLLKPEPRPMQSAWEFYSHVKDHIAYVHIKDGYFDESSGKEIFTWPGEGKGDVMRILRDLISRGYDGGISIEPHLASVVHDTSVISSEEAQMNAYIEYGRRVESMINDIKECG